MSVLADSGERLSEIVEIVNELCSNAYQAGQSGRPWPSYEEDSESYIRRQLERGVSVSPSPSSPPESLKQMVQSEQEWLEREYAEGRRVRRPPMSNLVDPPSSPPEREGLTVAEARAALRAGQRIRVVVGVVPGDPTVILHLDDDGMVISEAVAGWSEGVVEAVCEIESDFLAEFLDGYGEGRHLVEIVPAPPSSPAPSAVERDPEALQMALERAVQMAQAYERRVTELENAAREVSDAARSVDAAFSLAYHSERLPLLLAACRRQRALLSDTEGER